MIVYSNFEWDVRQAAACLATSGVTFKEASTVFAGDDVAISEDSTPGQLRAVGRSARGRVLVVLHQRGVRIRILGVMLQSSRAAKALAQPPAEEEVASASAAAEKPVEAKATSEKPAEAKAAAEKPLEPKAAADRPASARAAARKPVEVKAAAREPMEVKATSKAPVEVKAAPKEPVEAEATNGASGPDSAPTSGAGWTAEAYGIYWEAYSAARQEARLQGKSQREAQRLGRKAGEQAMAGRAEPAPEQAAAVQAAPVQAVPERRGSVQKRPARAGSWGAAAREVKQVG